MKSSKGKKLLLYGAAFLSICFLPIGGLAGTHPGREWILCQALARHNVPLVHWCIDHGARPNCHCIGETNPILLAMNDKQMLHYLHSHGGDMNLEEIHDDWSGNPLVHAVMRDDLIAVHNLMAEGASDESGNALSWVADPPGPNSAEIIRLLRQAGVHERPHPAESTR